MIDAARLPGDIDRPVSCLAGTTPRAWRIGLFALWLAIVAYLAAHHVFWRDEVRAFSLALSGDGLIGMAKAVHGEGHPLLWYLLLRAAHTLVPVREVLPAVGLAVGIAAAGLVAWRAPFRPVAIAGVLLGGWMVFEDTVMARNYGVATLLMLVIADRFARRREGAWSIGALLFLLCNSNVPAVILAAGFLLFWLAEILGETGWRWTPRLGRWASAATLALAGVAVCFLTVYPPFNEAAVSPLAAHPSVGAVIGAVLNVGPAMAYLWPQPLWGVPAPGAVVAVLVLAAPFSLLRSRAALVAGLATLPAMLLFFQLVYPGGYRHQALYLCFLVALHWMVASGRGGPFLARQRVGIVAEAAFLMLVLVQGVTTASLLVQTAQGRVAGQTAMLGRLLARPALRHAIVIADAEVMIEPVPYYAPNPTYMLRRHRFGAVTYLTHHADRHLTIGGILAAARRLQAATGRPVVILMQYPLDRGIVRRHWDEGLLGDVTALPGEVPAFLDATQRIARPIPLLHYGVFDEAYDVYVLKPAVTAS